MLGHASSSSSSSTFISVSALLLRVVVASLSLGPMPQFIAPARSGRGFGRLREAKRVEQAEATASPNCV